jgi:hypothetical protein
MELHGRDYRQTEIEDVMKTETDGGVNGQNLI